jgi:hypothetical protein
MEGSVGKLADPRYDCVLSKNRRKYREKIKILLNNVEA